MDNEAHIYSAAQQWKAAGFNTINLDQQIQASVSQATAIGLADEWWFFSEEFSTDHIMFKLVMTIIEGLQMYSNKLSKVWQYDNGYDWLIHVVEASGPEWDGISQLI